jgi:hypothetical protein
MSSAASHPLSSLQMHANSLRHGVPVSPLVNRILNGSKDDVFIIENTNPLDDGDLSVKYIIDDIGTHGLNSRSDNDDRYWDWKSLSKVNILQYIPAMLASWGNWKPGDEFYTREISQNKHNPPDSYIIIELPSNLKHQFFIRTKNTNNKNTIHDWTREELENANIVKYTPFVEPPSAHPSSLQAAAAAISSSQAAVKYWHGKKGKGKKRGGSIKHKRRIRLKKTLKRKTK